MSNLGSRVVDVIEIRIHSGKGTKEEPYKFSRQYWSKKGEFLCEIDEKGVMPVVEANAAEKTKSIDTAKNIALSGVRAVRRFIKKRYYAPDAEAFSGWQDFEGWMNDLCKLENYINDIPEDLSALDKNP